MRFPSRVQRAMAAAILVAWLVVPGTAGQAAAAPAYTLEERAEAIARPALVFIEVRAKGFVRNKVSGELISPEPVTLSNRCSGFMVSAEGHMLTVDHCAQPSDTAWRNTSFGVLVDRMIIEKRLTGDQRAAFLADLNANATFTGPDPNEKPEIKLFAQHNAVQAGQASIPGEVVATRSSADENIALIKLAVGGLPVVEIEAAPVAVDERLTLLAYANVTSSSADGTFAPRSRDAKIAKAPTAPAGPSRLDADLGTSSHGGMAVDRRGKAVGLINLERGVKDQPRRLLIPGATLQSLLDAQGVVNALGSTDLTYRAALDSYFGGRYTQAISGFDAVLNVVPDHGMASSYRKQAMDRLAIEGDAGVADGPSFLILLVAAVVGAVMVVVIVLAVGMVRRRRAPKPRPREIFGELAVSPYTPVSAVPVSAYPVSDDDLSRPEIERGWTHTQYPPPSNQDDLGTDPYYAGGNPWAAPASRPANDVQNGQ